ncbi:glycosyltransferase family 4 protein [Mesorhizobium sp.]|uniref:glycosyltransferase family 4 protein n=1 Tax=Mesorhizobium sp. TaxID=1871066 RepID=UPI0025D61549|nr:glycosyltransferase family 4 protein [Mesorhizobium sp.]
MNRNVMAGTPRLKVAIGIFRLHPRGGLEDHAFRISSALCERGHEVDVYTTGEVSAEGFTTHVLKRRGFSNHARMQAFASDFRRATENRYERTIAFHPSPGCDILILGDYPRNRRGTGLWRRMLPRFITYAELEAGCFEAGARTRVIGLARRQMDMLLDRYPALRSRSALLPPSIAPELCQPERRSPDIRAAVRDRLGIEQGAPVWLWTGLQPRVKGLDRAIEALARFPNAVLLVAGLSPDSHRLASLLRTVELSDRVRFLGYMSKPQLIDHFAAADLMVHPARVEVTGAVILEALINGLPVVATDVCGFAAHVAQASAGKVLPTPFDPEKLIEAIAEVSGARNAAYSASGIAYGRQADLYSGIAAACDLIEADRLPQRASEQSMDQPASRLASSGIDECAFS